jgi:chromosome segregation ATPase
MGRGLFDSTEVGRTLDQYAVEIGPLLIVLTTGAAAWIVSRRRYVKSADFKRGMEALRLEFRRSLDDTRTATVKRAAAIGDNLLSVIKPLDVAVTDLNVRLERLEEHADAVSSFMAGPQRHASEDNERIDARLMKVEQSLKALIEQLSLLKQTMDEVTAQERETGNSIESLDSRLMDARKQADGLSSRLELGEKARADLGSLIGLFVKQLKRVNVNSAETALRVADLEGLRSKVSGLEARLSPVGAQDKSLSTGNSTENNNELNGDTPMKAKDTVDFSETNNGGENTIEQPATSANEAPDDAAGVRAESHSENGSAGQHPA